VNGKEGVRTTTVEP
jgi:hypothetical protein